MATGNSTFLGLAVPLFGESEIKQQTAATDILTITGATSQSGDFITCQNVSGTDKFAVRDDGKLLLSMFTTKPTTGMVKGELMLLFHNDNPKLGVCWSLATQAVIMVPLSTATLGRLTA